MSGDIRKYTIILAVAVLFSIFSYAFSDAFTSEAEYPDMCREAQNNNNYYEPRPLESKNCTQAAQPTDQQIQACPGQLNMDYRTCEYGCSCYEITQQNQQTNDRIKFYLGVILGGLAIAFGMLLNPKKKLNTWIGSGFILGGLITIFIATVGYWGDLDKIIRPIVIAAELGLILWIAYKKFQ
jgi:hypothetical protein